MKTELNHPILVVIGILQKKPDMVFIAKRDFHVHMGGKWEFPGGKVEEGETLEQALARELHEEVGVEMISSKHICTIHYQYDIKAVQLECYLVSEFTGEPHGKEGQPVKWINRADVNDYEFPTANTALIEAVINLQ